MTSNINPSNNMDRSNFYSYIANGIPIHSEIEFPELKSGPLHSNVTIRLGEVPKQIMHPIYEGPTSQAGANQYLLSVRNVATYFLQKEGGQYSITIAPIKGVPMSEVRVFVLSSMFGALCHMQNFLPLHASGVVINGKAVLFCGKSGLGKSTLCAALYQKGNPFITDNLAAIYVEKGGDPMVHPSYSHLRLWQDSIDALESFSGNVVKMRDEVEKFNLILDSQIQDKAVPLGKIYHLNQSISNEIVITPLTGRKKAVIIVNETFRAKLLKGLGSQESYFRLLNQICEKTEIAKIDRPIDSFLLEELINLVLEDLKQMA